MWTRVIVVAVALLGGGAASASAASAAVPGAPSCAKTTDPSTPAGPSPGKPCWTDVTPYPFGSDGNPVDPSSGLCGALNPPGPNWQGDYTSPCYLRATSMAFRAWNRGLAATNGTAFGVWLFNGTRWFPDPSFPGSNVCKGNTVLWAGKLDYWLIGGATAWSGLCRFDGVNLEWQPLAIPPSTFAHVPANLSQGSLVPKPGRVTSGACFAWDNCWFFGSYGVVLHWDGQLLRDASPVASPWLQGGFTAAVARTDGFGNRFGFAVSMSAVTDNGSDGVQLPAQPDGAPPPQLFGSTGGAFSPLPFSPPTAPLPGDPYRTDLVAVDFNTAGDGWVAGNPVGRLLGTTGGSPRQSSATQPSPLTRLGPDGAAAPCAGFGASTFTYSGTSPLQSASYLWSSLSLIPGTSTALAAGQMQPTAAGAAGGDGQPEPVLVQAACAQAPVATRFRVPNPYYADQANAPLVPADRSIGSTTGYATSVAANAVNDAWAATSVGLILIPGACGGPDCPQPNPQRPHLYHLTDGQPPLAPTGNDYEPRPSLFVLDPPVYVESPPTYVPPPQQQQTSYSGGGTKHRRKHQKASIYGVQSKLHRGPNGSFTLYITFRVRRPVTIGVEALHRGRVVGSSGLKRFRGKRGELTLQLDPRRWPTGLRFVTPRKGGA